MRLKYAERPENTPWTNRRKLIMREWQMLRLAVHFTAVPTVPGPQLHLQSILNFLLFVGALPPPPTTHLPRVLFATEARGFLASPHYLHMYAPLFFRATGLYIFFTLLLLWPLLNNLPAGTSTSHLPLTTSPFHPSHHSGLGVRATETSGSDAAW